MTEKPFEHSEDFQQIEELKDNDRIDLILRKTTDLINALVSIILINPDKCPEFAQRISRINRLMIDINIHSSNLANDELKQKEYSLISRLSTIDTNNPAELIRIVLSLYLSLESQKLNKSEFAEEFGPRVRLGIYIKFVKQIMQELSYKADHKKLLELGKMVLLLEDSAGDDQKLLSVLNEIQLYIESNFLNKPHEFNKKSLKVLISKVEELYDNYGLVVQ